jgi:hypothetical protein
MSIDLRVLASRCSPTLPRRGPADFLFAAGAVTAVLWLSGIVGQPAQGYAPRHLDSYMTMVTDSVDQPIITPACLVASYLLLRRAPSVCAMAFPLFGIVATLVPGIIAATVSQLAAGVTLNTGVIVGRVAGLTSSA